MSDTKRELGRAKAHAKGVSPPPLNAGRSRNMQAIRRADTKPELELRQALHRRGLRYRKDLRLDIGDMKVRPDVVFTQAKVAVFVDGCFWHVCPVHGRQPTVNDWYWAPKLRRTMERDKAATAALETAGWTVVRLWEHVELTDAVERVVSALGQARIEHACEDSGTR